MGKEKVETQVISAVTDVPSPDNVIPANAVAGEEEGSSSSLDQYMKFEKEGVDATGFNHDVAMSGSNNDILAMPDYDNAVSVDVSDIQLTDSVVKVRVESEMSEDRESIIVTP